MGGWKDYLRMLLGWKAGQTAIIIAGPFRVDASQVYQAGMVASQVYQAGMVASQVYQAGMVASQVASE